MSEFGFWTTGKNLDDRPDPRELVDKGGYYRSNPQVFRKIMEYLCTFGCLESFEIGYSFCRFSPTCTARGFEMGCCTFTDGVWCWPEGLLHYVLVHKILLPENFICHIIENNSLRNWQSLEPKSKNKKMKDVLMWDPGFKSPVPIPQQQKYWLKKHSTIFWSLDTHLSHYNHANNELFKKMQQLNRKSNNSNSKSYIISRRAGTQNMCWFFLLQFSLLLLGLFVFDLWGSRILAYTNHPPDF